MSEDFPAVDDETQLSPKFPYQPLDPSRQEIRLLELRPGEESSPIQASLIKARLSEDLLYEALSYAWGEDPSMTVPISLISNTHPQQCTIQVTTSLAIALKQLRYTDSVRVIWADAICINQSDISERNQQVRIMDEIYRFATRVCVSLGEEAHSSNEAMSLIALPIEDIISSKLISNPSWGLAWRALTFLVQRRWFQRCWVVQEVALAKEIILYCGSATAPWDHLLLQIRALHWDVSSRPSSKGRPAHHADDRTQCEALTKWEIFDDDFKCKTTSGVSRIWRLNGAKLSVGKLGMKGFLNNCSYSDCSYPRDAVYSMLGIAKGAKSMSWCIDYEKETIEVFIDAVENIVEATGSLDILCHSRWTENHDHGHRHSWVPRFAGGFERCGCVGFFANGFTISYAQIKDTMENIELDRSLYSASGSHKANIHFDRSNRQISVAGTVVDKVTKALDPLVQSPVRHMPQGYTMHIPKQWREAAMYSANTIDNKVHHGKRFDAFWRTLVADRNNYISAHELHVSSFSDFEEIFSLEGGRYIKQALSPAPQEWASEAEAWIEPDMTFFVDSRSAFLRKLSSSIPNRRFIITEKSMGLAPEESRVGDLVCVLLGCSVPVILRPVKGSSGLYNFVGEAYVHGMMDGQAIEKLENGEFKMERFLIT
ncbi:hypothetical protein HYFRA_00006709 [Hymenoscyphus fraxineus]|uniref:Heterokaryon incompatibility domain-containing protein n=1 Tax=Hymenoscyphus fraxineus TaxID=746836 RepID=A0A9N9KYI4_9HELO|nr:hypothetical protein HYFRA_00006709 [Hymenoscyphus fraxineus]